MFIKCIEMTLTVVDNAGTEHKVKALIDPETGDRRQWGAPTDVLGFCVDTLEGMAMAAYAET